METIKISVLRKGQVHSLARTALPAFDECQLRVDWT